MGRLPAEETHRYFDCTTRTTYKSILLLGKGGFAKCYQVRNEATLEQSALKVIDRKNMSDNQYLKVQREIKIHKGLDHPHIVRLANSFEDAASVYIVMELCSEKSLLNLINENSRLTEQDSQYYLRGIVSAVTFLLSYDIIHRDIKPGNILLKEAGSRTVVKLADFGLACYLREVSGSSVSGTPNYLAPEVLARKGHSAASEAWSIGCLLFCMVTGLPPFDSQSIGETYRRIAAGEYHIPPGIGLSPAVQSLIEGLLQVRVSDRLSVDDVSSSAFMRTTFTRTFSNLSNVSSIRSGVSLPPSRSASRATTLSSGAAATPGPGAGAGAPVVMMPSSPSRSRYSPPSPPPPAPPRSSLPPPPTTTVLPPPPPPRPFAYTPHTQSSYGFDTTRSHQSQSQSHHSSSSSLLSLSPSLPPALCSDLDVHSATLASLISGVRSISSVKIGPPLHVSKWVDYTNKYGFGCLLSDGTTTVKFNSGDIVALRSDDTGIYAKTRYMKPVPLNRADPEIDSLVGLTRSYKTYMETQLAKAATVGETRENRRWNEMSTPYLTHYSKKKGSLMMVLSDGTTQINFVSAHIKLIISPESAHSSILSFIDASGHLKSYRTSCLPPPLSSPQSRSLSSDLLNLLRDSNEFIADEMSYLRSSSSSSRFLPPPPHHARASQPLTTSC